MTDDNSDAEKWRLQQAEELMREVGFVERPDGTWAYPGQTDDEDQK